jgi:hypothetical protein
VLKGHKSIYIRKSKDLKANKTYNYTMKKLNNKAWFKSKTLWLNLVLFALGILEWIQGELGAGRIVTFVALLNFALRLMTTKALSFKSN